METDLYRRIGKEIKKSREKRGISQEDLAKRLGYTSPATISHFETGQRKISIADLQRVADILGMHMAQLVHSPSSAEYLNNYLLRAASTSVKPSAREEIVSFLAFSNKLGHSQPKVPTGLKNLSAGEAAKAILEHARIEHPPISPRVVAESINVPVIDWDFPDEISGIIAVERKAAWIGVNENHPYVRQRFTIAHELGHLIFHDDNKLFVDFVKVEMSPSEIDDEQRRQETQANWFAADLLMPKDWITEDFANLGEEGIPILVQKYKVSEQALWFRLLNLKLVNG